MNNEADNTDLESPESTKSTSSPMPVKQKNPKRVEAGRKGAAARKAKLEDAKAVEAAKAVDAPKSKTIKSETESAKTEIEPSEITKDEPQIKQHVNLPKNYKNYFIPIGIVALATGFYFISMQPKKEKKQINPTAKTAVKKVYDPFDD